MFVRIVRTRIALIALFVLGQMASACSAQANPGFGSSVALRASIREGGLEGPFSVPAKLRGRVDFWKDIFSKYGRAQAVIHHRDFPQIVFGVIDLSQQFEVMAPAAFEAYRETVIKRTVEDTKRQLLELASGAEPRTPFQKRAVNIMERFPGGPFKFRKLVDDDLVRTQTGIRERYAEAIRRAWRYLPIMEQIFVAEYGLPKELTRIPFIESSFDYTAYSSVGAAGIWQFMPRTARSHRMIVGRHVDDRRDPIKATRAAAEYLRSAYNSLGSWPLAITSYNHGVGGVRAKVRRAGTQDLATILEDPTERYFGFASSNFFPEFLAALEIFNDPHRYFPEVTEEPPLRVVSYPVRAAVSAPYVATRLGITTDELREANYGLLDTVWRGKASIPAGYTLRVPAHVKEGADRLFGNGDLLYQKVGVVPVTRGALPAVYTAKRGETLDSIADKMGIAKSDIMRINRLSSTRLAPGQQLRLLVDSGESSAQIALNTSRPEVKQSYGKTERYIVQRGDSLASIARKNNISIEQIKKLNKLKGSSLRVGQTLRMPGGG